MKKFIIITDSCSDLEKKYRDQYDIQYIPNTYSFNGREVSADLDWKEVSEKEFYDLMRDGIRILTAQVTAAKYREAFENAIKEGYDVLSISCSSALSSGVKSSYIIRDELLAKYPEAKIICIDSLMSCSGLGLLCMRASELRSEGKTIEEVAKWVEDNKLNMHQEAVADKLIYLKRAGRVSAASAFFGGLLNIKPLIISDVRGRNAAVEKVKGKKAAFERIAERIKERIVDVPYQRIFIGHADYEEGALELKQVILDRLGNPSIDIHVCYIGPMVGASVGPGTIGVYFYGTEETYDSEVNN